MKYFNYAITRHGSNAFNQSMCDQADIDIISAPNCDAAEELAYARVKEGRYSVYANQRLTARPLSSLSKEDCQLLEEAVYYAEQEVEASCIVCGKPIGKLPRWQAVNAWCGCVA